MTTADHAATVSDTASDRLLVVSGDGHVAPPLEHFREYCPKRYLGDFDEFARAYAEGRIEGFGEVVSAQTSEAMEDGFKQALENLVAQETIHYDPHAVLEIMDSDGIAAETFYHGSFNRSPIPFLGRAIFGAGQPYIDEPRYYELAAAGVRIYNRWLADAFCSADPGRLIGLAHLPMWDPQLAVAEVEFAHSVGLRGVNFPAPRPGIPDFNELVWEPFWTTVEAYDMSLNTHGGSTLAAKDLANYTGVDAFMVMTFDNIVFSRRGLPFMIYGGVFERHPGLRLIFSEQPSEWVESTLNDMDGLWGWSRIKPTIPRKPSEYFAENCYVCVSFMSNREAKAAVEQGHVANTLWGRDFPHLEGTWPYTSLALRKTMEGIPTDAIQRMLGQNAVRAFGLDAAKLAGVAARIGPRLSDVTIPIRDGELPEATKWTMAFRGDTAWV